jgi:WD40 repeat protein
MKGSVTNIQLLRDNCVSALSFSHKADYCTIATKKDHVLHIFKVRDLTNINSWTLLQGLKDHTQTIADIDWAPDNKILSSSHDRSVFVWKQVG